MRRGEGCADGDALSEGYPSVLTAVRLIPHAAKRSLQPLYDSCRESAHMPLGVRYLDEGAGGGGGVCAVGDALSEGYPSAVGDV